MKLSELVVLRANVDRRLASAGVEVRPSIADAYAKLLLITAAKAPDFDPHLGAFHGDVWVRGFDTEAAGVTPLLRFNPRAGPRHHSIAGILFDEGFEVRGAFYLSVIEAKQISTFVRGQWALRGGPALFEEQRQLIVALRKAQMELDIKHPEQSDRLFSNALPGVR